MCRRLFTNWCKFSVIAYIMKSDKKWSLFLKNKEKNLHFYIKGGIILHEGIAFLIFSIERWRNRMNFKSSRFVYDYIINRKTMAIVPVLTVDNRILSGILEEEDTFIALPKPYEVVDQSCRFHGSSFEGSNHIKARKKEKKSIEFHLLNIDVFRIVLRSYYYKLFQNYLYKRFLLMIRHSLPVSSKIL